MAKTPINESTATMLHIRVTEDLRKKLAVVAAAENTNMTSIVNRLIETYVARNLKAALAKVKE